jgi:hypothetical protein
MLANSVSMSCGIPIQLHVDADLLAKVKWVIDHLKQLLQHVIRGRSVGPVDRYLHHLAERIVIGRMASVMSLPTNFDTALTTPSFAPMTD